MQSSRLPSSPERFNAFPRLFVYGLCVLLAGAGARAAVLTWDGGGGDSNFSNPLNWDTDMVPMNGDTVILGPGAPAALNNDLPAGLQVLVLTIASGSGAMTISGNAFELSGIGGGITVASNAMDNVISTGITLGNTQTFDIGESRTLTLGGALSGSGVLTKTGLGTLVLSVQSPSFTGGVTLNEGVLELRSFNTQVLGVGTVLSLNGGQLSLLNDANRNFTANSVDVVVGGNTTIFTDRLTPPAANGGLTTTFRSLSIGAQTLTLERGSVIAAAGTGSGRVDFNTTTLTGNAVFDPGTRSIIDLGVVGDGGNGYSVTLSGGGTGSQLFIAGGSTYSGGTILNGGTLRAEGANSLGTGDITSISASTLDLRDADSIAGRTVNVTTAGTLTLSLFANAGTTFNAGAINVDSGRALTLNPNRVASPNVDQLHTLAAPITFAGDGTLSSTGGNGYDVSVTSGITTTSGTLTISAGAADLTLAGAVSGGAGIRKTGTGLLNLSSANTFSGVMAVEAGTADLLAADALAGTSGITLSGGTLRLSHGADASLINDAATLSFAGGILDLAGTVAHSETVGSTTLVAGTLSTLTRSTGTSTINLNAITVESGGLLDIAADGIATTDNLNVNGLLDPGIRVNGAWAANQTGAADGAIIAFTGYTDVNRLGGSIADGPASLVRIVEAGVSGDITLAGPGVTTVYGLLQDSGTGTATIDVGGGNTLRIGAQGVFIPAAKSSITVNNGTLTAGSADNTAATLNVAVENAAEALTVNSVLADNGTGVVGVSKTGAGTLVLAGGNTFTGGLSVHSGVVQLGGAGALNSTTPNAVNLAGSGATLRLNGNSVTVSELSGVGGLIENASAGVATLTVDQAANTSFAGTIADGAGGGSLALVKNGSGRLYLTSAGSTYSGGVTLNSGTLAFALTGSDNNNSPFGLGTLRLSGGTLQLDSGGGNKDVHVPVVIAGNFTLDNVSAIPTDDLDFTDVVTLEGGSHTITMLEGNGTRTRFNGGITDGGMGYGITKEGTGRLEIATGNNTFTGAIVVNEGTLDLTGDNSANWNNSHAAVLNGGTLRLNNNESLGGRVLTITGGTLSAFSGTGRTLTNDLVVNGDFTLGQASGGTGSLTLNGAVDLGAGNRTITVDNGSDALNGVISGSGGFTKAGTGRLDILGANTLAGGITVNGGILRAIGQTAAGNPTVPTVNPLAENQVTLGAGAELEIRDNADGTTTGQTIQYGNAIHLAGNAQVDADRLNGSSTSKSIRFGEMTIANGVDTLTTRSANGYNLHFLGGANGIVLPGNFTFDVTTGNTVLYGANYSLGGNVTALSDGGNGYGLTKNGNGTLTLGKSLLGGVVTVNAGTLRFDNANNELTGGVQVNAGNLELRTGNALNGEDLDFLGDSTLRFRINNATTFNVTSVDVGAAVTSLTVDANRASGSNTDLTHTLNAPVTTAGALQLNVVGANGYDVGLNGSLALGGNLAINTDTADLIVGATIADGGGGFSIQKTGAGVLILNGAATHLGTQVDAGTLVVNANHSGAVTLSAGTMLGGAGTVGSVDSTGATIAPGSSPGILTVTGDFTLDSAASILAIEITGLGGLANAGVTYDQIVIGGAVVLGDATLSLDLGGFTGWQAGDVYTIIDSVNPIGLDGQLTYMGNELNEGDMISIDAGFSFMASYVGGSGTDLTLTVVAVPEPGTVGLMMMGSIAGLVYVIRRRRA